MRLKRTGTIVACLAVLATIPLLTGCSTGQSTTDACNQVGPIVSSFNNDIVSAWGNDTTPATFTPRANKDLAALHKSYASVTDSKVKSAVTDYEKKSQTFVTAIEAQLAEEQKTGQPTANDSPVLKTTEDAQDAWVRAYYGFTQVCTADYPNDKLRQP